MTSKGRLLYSARFRAVVLTFFLFIPPASGWQATAAEPGLDLPGFSFRFPAAPDESWSLGSDNEGIRVFSREIAASRVREVLAETVVAAPLEAILSVIEDFEHYPEFMPYVKECNTLGSRDGKTVVFQRLSFPLPLIDDRYYTILIGKVADPFLPSGRIVAWDLDPESTTRSSGVQVATNHGGWRLLPLASDSTEVIYYVHTDPGGSIGPTLANFANSIAVPLVMKKVRARVEELP